MSLLSTIHVKTVSANPGTNTPRRHISTCWPCQGVTSKNIQLVVVVEMGWHLSDDSIYNLYCLCWALSICCILQRMIQITNHRSTIHTNFPACNTLSAASLTYFHLHRHNLHVFQSSSFHVVECNLSLVLDMLSSGSASQYFIEPQFLSPLYIQVFLVLVSFHPSLNHRMCLTSVSLWNSTSLQTLSL